MGKGSKARPRRRVPATTLARMVVSFGLLITAALVMLTGVVLYLSTTQYLYRVVAWFPADKADMIHTYAGFVMAGLSVVHVYLNWGSIKSYIRLIRSLA